VKQLAAAWALIALIATAAQATEVSEALSARGLVEMNQDHIGEAMVLFDRAIEADPQDALARYHRGVAYAKQGDFEKAAVDLEEALKLRPNLDEAALELGIALVELGRNEEAVRWLKQAQARPDLDGQASFFLGIAYLRTENLDEARTELERARLKDPSVELSSRYYLGVVEYRSGAQTAAREHFTFVEQQSPQSAVGRESTAFLEVIRAGQGTDSQIYGAVSVEYDTNVVLAPASGLPSQAISNAADGRVTLNAGGVYVPWRSDRARLVLGYDFYQNLQFQLHDFNLMDNRPTVQFIYDFGPVHAGVLAQYDFYLLETTTFLQTVTASPWVVIPEKEFGRTELFVRYQYRDYLDNAFSQLTGNDYSGGVRQVFSLGDGGQEAWISYTAESMDTTDTKLYAFDANAIELALIWPLPWSTTAQIGYRYRREQYDPESTIFAPSDTGPRLDRENRGGVAFRKDLNGIVSLVAAWVGTFNLSNKDAFEYNRQIGSLGVEVRY
jgi:tetratricopeptide (TPR) repeat protein